MAEPSSSSSSSNMASPGIHPVKVLYKGTMISLGTELRNYIIQMGMFPLANTDAVAGQATVYAQKPDWLDKNSWSQDIGAIFTLLDRLKNDIDYATLSVEIDDSMDATDYRQDKVTYAEYGALLKLKILWDDKFIEFLEKWEYGVTYLHRYKLFPTNEPACGFVVDVAINKLRWVLQNLQNDAKTGKEFLAQESTEKKETEKKETEKKETEKKETEKKETEKKEDQASQVRKPFFRDLLKDIKVQCPGCIGSLLTPLPDVIGRCNKCKLQGYCSVEHQGQDWARHKDRCKAACKIRPGCGNHHNDMLITCRECGCRSTEMSRCGKCEKVSYCSKEAQKSDWKRHRKECCK